RWQADAGRAQAGAPAAQGSEQAELTLSYRRNGKARLRAGPFLFDLGAGGGEVYRVRETSHIERTISRYRQVDEQAAIRKAFGPGRCHSAPIDREHRGNLGWFLPADRDERSGQSQGDRPGVAGRN